MTDVDYSERKGNKLSEYPSTPIHWYISVLLAIIYNKYEKINENWNWISWKSIEYYLNNFCYETLFQITQFIWSLCPLPHLYREKIRFIFPVQNCASFGLNKIQFGTKNVRMEIPFSTAEMNCFVSFSWWFVGKFPKQMWYLSILLICSITELEEQYRKNWNIQLIWISEFIISQNWAIWLHQWWLHSWKTHAQQLNSLLQRLERWNLQNILSLTGRLTRILSAHGVILPSRSHLVYLVSSLNGNCCDWMKQYDRERFMFGKLLPLTNDRQTYK